MKLEVACFNLESAIIAVEAGADRIELCEDYSSGGITPSISDFIKLKHYTNIPIYVMIRPRSGDFVYNEKEVNTMLVSIKEFVALGVDGFVFGCLRNDNTIDTETNQLLIEATDNLPSTFHRAFDKIEDYKQGLAQVIELGFKNILTSGGVSKALDGIERLNELNMLANNRIDLVCGGGVRSSNIKELKEKFTTIFYHSSGIINEGEVADRNEIERLKQLLNN